MYDLQDWAAVQRVYKQTRSKRATAKILGMSRNTVRSLLEEKEAIIALFKAIERESKELFVALDTMINEKNQEVFGRKL